MNAPPPARFGVGDRVRATRSGWEGTVVFVRPRPLGMGVGWPGWFYRVRWDRSGAEGVSSEGQLDAVTVIVN